MAVRAALIWNPAAGRRPELRRQQVQQVARDLERGGWSLTLSATTPDGGAALAASTACAAGCEIIVGCGGDGTLYEIVNGIMAAAPGSLDARPALGVVPLGTANILGHALGCPRNPAHAAAALLRARPVPRPLGRARTSTGTHWFAAVASVGLDAHVVHAMDAAAKRRWGKLAYAASALVQAPRYFPAPFELQSASGNRISSADGLIVGLSRFYGGRLKLGAVAPGDAIALALRANPVSLLCQTAALLTFGLERAPGVTCLPHPDLGIPTQGRPVELDGEPAGFTPAQFTVIPAALRMLQPPTLGPEPSSKLRHDQEPRPSVRSDTAPPRERLLGRGEMQAGLGRRE